MSDELLASWSKAGDHTVLLPTGMWAQIRLPDPEIFFRSGRLPDDLRKFAVMFTTSGIDSTTLPADDAPGFMQFLYALAAETIRGLAPKSNDRPADADFRPLRVSGPELREMDVPPEDFAAIISIANRRRTPAAVTTESAFDLGLSAVFEASREAAAAARAGALPGWQGFRGERRGADRGPDSGTVRPAAVGADGGNRAARRVRARRGASG